MTGGTSYQDNELGQEINLAATYSLLEGLDLTLSAAWFLPGDGFTPVGSAIVDDAVQEYYTKIEWEF